MKEETETLASDMIFGKSLIIRIGHLILTKNLEEDDETISPINDR